MARSLQEIHRLRRQEEFVGREEQLAFFEDNLKRPPDDPRRRFIISVSGQGGVGKTWLLRQFQRIAKAQGAVTAWSDDLQEEVPEVLGCLADQFADQGHPLKAFAERYEVYRQRREEIEADPEAPRDVPRFLGRTLAKGGLRLARRVPVGGVIADFVDEEAFASLVGDFATYVARKIGNKDEVRLVLEPDEVLTPLFLKGLREIADEKPVALFFDTWERTGRFLDPWLRGLLDGRYGDVPANILLVLAGRDELDRNRWVDYEELLARLPLEPFTEEEAREYLALKGLTDERVVEVVLSLSGRLPLLLATLSAQAPTDPSEVGDPSGEAVERFLKWVEDPRQRQVALDGALPRRLNRDVLAVLTGEEQADALFDWLQGMPFVRRRGDAWAYHETVRTHMLRYKRRLTPQGWADRHGRLAEHYGRLRDGLGLEGETARRDETWQGYVLEALYHRLCQDPHRLGEALNGFAAAWDASDSFARRWAESVRQAGLDGESEVLERWGERLLEGLDAWQAGRHPDVLSCLTALLEEPALEDRPRASLLGRRGVAYALLGKYEQALADLDRAIELNPDYALVIARRGWTYGLMVNYEQALADLDRAIALDPDDAWAIARRGWTYRRMGKYGQALADLDRAIALDPDDAWAIASRGVTCRLMGKYEQALADLDRAIALNPNLDWAIARRGETYALMRKYERALADLDRAIALNPDDWYLYSRALTYRLLNRPGLAQADLQAAIRQAGERYREAPRDWRNTLNLALYYLVAGEAARARQLYAEALAGGVPFHLLRAAVGDLNDFLALFPDHPHAREMRDRLQAHLEGTAG